MTQLLYYVNYPKPESYISFAKKHKDENFDDQKTHGQVYQNIGKQQTYISEMKSDSCACIQLVIDARTKVPDKL